jgi:hypothetical protein
MATRDQPVGGDWDSRQSMDVTALPSSHAGSRSAVLGQSSSEIEFVNQYSTNSIEVSRGSVAIPSGDLSSTFSVTASFGSMTSSWQGRGSKPSPDLTIEKTINSLADLKSQVPPLCVDDEMSHRD